MLSSTLALLSLVIAAPVLAQGIEVIPIEPTQPAPTFPAPNLPSPTLPAPTTQTQGQNFVCQFQNGQSVVSYQPESQLGRSYLWALPRNLGGGWSSDRRCQEIARRLESYRPDGLNELQISRENGYNTVCATTDRVPSCRIVFTVPPGQDPTLTRDQVFANLVSAEQGQITAPVNTFTGTGLRFTDRLRGSTYNRSGSTGSRGIKLKPYLAPRDGGSGRNL